MQFEIVVKVSTLTIAPPEYGPLLLLLENEQLRIVSVGVEFSEYELIAPPP